ncbi:MAG TPA: hypothetical protein VNG71_02030 [Pyrinomonadaceae bacterium]|nr:hypothetical protein [Pyrinomonadaceae bacterium]
MREEEVVGEKRTIRAEYYHDDSGAPAAQQEIVRNLGFTHVGEVREFPRTRTTFVQLEKVPHLIRIIE